MIYLLEGPDGTGKTTFAKYLVDSAIASKKTCLYFHCTNTSNKYKSSEEGYTDFLKDLQHYKELDYDVVIDRAWVSNIVYTKVFEPEKEYTSKTLSEKLFEIVDYPIICLPKDRKSYLQKFEELKQTREEAFSSMEKIYDEFSIFAERYIRYDMLEHTCQKNPQKGIADFLDSIKGESYHAQ